MVSTANLQDDDPEMSPINRKLLHEVTPKCMCKSKRGRRMNVILEFRYPNQHNNCFSPLKVYFRQFASTGAWIEMNKILGWQCPNCYKEQDHHRIASIVNAVTGETRTEERTNEGIVISRGKVEDIWYAHIALVPQQLSHLISNEWKTRSRHAEERVDGGGHLLPWIEMNNVQAMQAMPLLNPDEDE